MPHHFDNKATNPVLNSENPSQTEINLTHNKHKFLNYRKKPMTIVNKSDLNSAHHTKIVVASAINALKNIDAKSVRCVENHEKITAFKEWLEDFLSQADFVINTAKNQYDNRDQCLINKAFARLAQIPDDRLIAKFQVENLANNYKMKIASLKKEGGFADAEIDQIIQYPEEEIERNKGILVALDAETKQVEAYLSDAPRFDVELLKGTRIYPGLVATE